jgi:hypothetical protein
MSFRVGSNINKTMRAAEFLRSLADIIDALDGDSGDLIPKNPEEKDSNPVMVPPLQQEVELAKAGVGKTSPIIQKLTHPESEHDLDNPIFPQ